MADRTHAYELELEWTGDRGTGTSGYRDYSRDHQVRFPGIDQVLYGSADRTFHGDSQRLNPEQLLLSALSQCHLLSYLHVCVLAGVRVTGYADRAAGAMRTESDGSGRFVEVVLRPRVTIAPDSDPAAAEQAHEGAHRMCFIANSVNFPVRIEPTVRSQ